MTKEDIYLFLVPSWHKNGTQLLNNIWPDNQPFIKKKMLTVPSSNSNGTHLSKKCTLLFQKKSWYLLSVLFLTSEPIKLSDLMNAFDYKNEKSFRDKYIKPLRQVDFIRFTNPETQTDPEDKYMLTEKGKSYLGGTLNIEH